MQLLAVHRPHRGEQIQRIITQECVTLPGAKNMSCERGRNHSKINSFKMAPLCVQVRSSPHTRSSSGGAAGGCDLPRSRQHTLHKFLGAVWGANAQPNSKSDCKLRHNCFCVADSVRSRLGQATAGCAGSESGTEEEEARSGSRRRFVRACPSCKPIQEGTPRSQTRSTARPGLPPLHARKGESLVDRDPDG